MTGITPITKTAGDVASYVKRQFGDESGTQMTDTDIYRWINSAQLEIIAQIQAVKAESTTDVVSGQDRYDLTALSIHQIESLWYDGKRLASKTFSEAERIIADSGLTTGTPQFWYQWASVVTLWPTPESSITDGLRIYYTKMPTSVDSPSDLLSLPDKHFESIVLWVMHKAFEMDEEFQQSAEVLERFGGRLMDQNEEEYFAKHATYQTITYVED